MNICNYTIYRLTGPSWKARQALSKARSTSVLRAALKRDEEEATKRQADAKLREEHEREERLLQEMLSENRDFIEDYLEKAAEKQAPTTDKDAEGAGAPLEGDDVTTGAVSGSNNKEVKDVHVEVAAANPMMKEKTFVTEMATAEDTNNPQNAETLVDDSMQSEACCFPPPLSRQVSLVKPVYTDWETSDKSLNYLERRLHLFNPTSDKRKAPVSLPKLKRFEAKVCSKAPLLFVNPVQNVAVQFLRNRCSSPAILPVAVAGPHTYVIFVVVCLDFFSLPLFPQVFSLPLFPQVFSLPLFPQVFSLPLFPQVFSLPLFPQESSFPIHCVF